MAADDIEVVLLNGTRYSQKSCGFQIAGAPYVGIAAMDYADLIEDELVHGANRDGAPLGSTSGKYVPDVCTMTMLADVFRKKFLPQHAALSAAMGGVGTVSAHRFPISVSMREGLAPPDLDVLSGCRILGFKDAYAEGAGVKVTEITIRVLSISRNGITLFDRTRSIP